MSHPGPSAVEILLSEEERAELVRRAGSPDRRSAGRARIILACAEGMSNAGAARAVGVATGTVATWRRKFAAERLAGLEDAARIGRPKAELVLSEAERDRLTRWARREDRPVSGAAREDRAALRGGRDEPAGRGRSRGRSVHRGPVAGPVHRQTPRWAVRRAPAGPAALDPARPGRGRDRGHLGSPSGQGHPLVAGGDGRPHGAVEVDHRADLEAV